MKIESNTKDFAYTDDGDFLLDPISGDLKSHTDENGEISVQTIVRRVFSNPGDWKMMPDYGSGISGLVGNETGSSLIQIIKSSIFDALTRELAFNSQDFEVKVIPLSLREYSVVILLRKSYMNKPVVVSATLDDNYFVNKNGKIKTIGLGR